MGLRGNAAAAMGVGAALQWAIRRAKSRSHTPVVTALTYTASGRAKWVVWLRRVEKGTNLVTEALGLGLTHSNRPGTTRNG